MRNFVVLAFMALLGCGSPATAEPFAELRAAYAARDANAAAAAYAPDAEVVYRYNGAPEERYLGTQPIASSFKALFDQIDSKDKLDLNFRQTSRVGNRVQGLYRLRIGRKQVSYGRYDVVLTASGKFASDTSASASREDFEEAPGAVMLDADDESLDRGYYAQLTGRYLLPDGCTLVVTRSVVRLFVRNSCTNDWRGLSRQSGRSWTAGDRVRSDKQITTYRFAHITGSASPSVEVVDAQGAKMAARSQAYKTEDVSFRAVDGTKLTGTIYMPTSNKKKRAATVMLHGSGPQDRDGYASIIAVLADELAASGRIVLAFDKRGSGGSDGDGDRAGFGVLASDARAAMAYLANRSEVDPSRIGLAGSSQAGWVAAKAIADGASPADVFLLGAAGTALTVAEQNLYNTEVRMRCQGIDARDVQLALDQQRAFFEFLRKPETAPKLDALTAKGQSRPGLGDWLFPDSRSTDRSAGQWYVVLNPFFDPLPVWKRYRGRMVFLFSEFDDSTPTGLAQARLGHMGTKTIFGAQHLGLATRDICNGEVSELSQFAPGLMPAVADFGKFDN
jgi:alpha/beta superfamily hydrolase/ketosteroid isomerase-like protein